MNGLKLQIMSTKNGISHAVLEPLMANTLQYNNQQTLVLTFYLQTFFSVVLLALVVSVGATGRAGDAGVFGNSLLKKAMNTNSLQLPPAQNIEGDSKRICCYLVVDVAFPLQNDIMKPCPHQNLDNDYGILANRFRIFLTTVKFDLDKVVDIILSSCCLHNFMIEKRTAPM